MTPYAKPKLVVGLVAFCTLCASCRSFKISELPTASDSALLEEMRKHGRNQLFADGGYRNHIIEEFARRRGWDDATLSKLKNGQLWVGATWEQVVLSWGWGDREDVTLTAYGRSVIWSYRKAVGSTFRTVATVHMDNGIVTIIGS